MEKKRLLIVTSELQPYNVLSDISELITHLPNQLAAFDLDIRILMPRFGTINERRHKLHEVVRLSGINVVFNDEDFPLMIKVASLPGSKYRLQVYFLDNDEFFKRKLDFNDEEGNFFEDNADRMIFFNRGVLDTVKKFGWSPHYVLCNGWFTSLLPLYIKTVYSQDPIFSNSQVIFSSFNKAFDGELMSDFQNKARLDDNISKQDFVPFHEADHKSLCIGAMTYSDGIVLAGNEVEKETAQFALKSGKPVFHMGKNDETSSSLYKFIKNIEESVNATA